MIMSRFECFLEAVSTATAEECRHGGECGQKSFRKDGELKHEIIHTLHTTPLSPSLC